MHRFKKIALIFDLSKSNAILLDHANELVKHNGVAVHIIVHTRVLLKPDQVKSIKSSINAKVDFDYQFEYMDDNAVIEIVQYCHKNQIDIVLMESDMVQGIKRIFHSSLTQSLVRKLHCPLWIVQRPVSKTYQRIVVAVDPTQDGEALALNDKLIEIGTSFAQQQSAECIVLTAWHLEGEVAISGPFLHTPIAEINALKAQCKIEHARAFEVLQARHTDRLTGSPTVLIEGEAGLVIPEYIEKNNIDMVLLGTVGRTGVKGFLIGNTAETLINQLDCSIMAVKPDGFQSPVLA